VSENEKRLESPAWHGAVLKEREAAYVADKLAASNWEQAKKRIKKNLNSAGHPGDELAPGTLNSVLKQAKLKEVT
jgi:hypothetical protein